MEESFLNTAMVGAVIGLAVVGLLVIFGYSRKPNFSAPPRRNRVVASPLPPAAALNRLRKLAGAAPYSLASDQPDRGLVVLSDSLSLASFGNFYPCFVAADGSGSTISVGISPRVPQYGPAVSRQLKKIVEAVQNAVAR